MGFGSGEYCKICEVQLYYVDCTDDIHDDLHNKICGKCLRIIKTHKYLEKEIDNE